MASKMFYVLAAAMIAIVALATPTTAQFPTGSGGVCCAFILNSASAWQLVCNNPTNVSEA